MKNVHILPAKTNRTSYLAFDRNNKLHFKGHAHQYNSSGGWSPMHACITSDEEVKEGNWVVKISSLYKGGGSIQKYSFIDRQFEDITFKKIILTTDPDLINDGIQSIDDNFLEWFVKNPSCESVEVEIFCGVCQSNDGECWRSKECSRGTYEDIYKIAISKEENIHDEYLKGDILEIFINNCISSGKYIDGVLNLKQKQILEIEDILGRYNDSKAKTKIRKILEPKHERICNCGLKESEHNVRHPFIPKQETPEEAAEKIYNDNLFDYEKYRDGFITGAKWQAERMYSEEEVLKLLIYCKDRFGGSELYDYVSDEEVKEWFKQSKKK